MQQSNMKTLTVSRTNYTSCLLIGWTLYENKSSTTTYAHAFISDC